MEISEGMDTGKGADRCLRLGPKNMRSREEGWEKRHFRCLVEYANGTFTAG
jgi:hypothetical protein